MFNEIVINIVLSLIIIIVIHELWEYMKNTYSTKKTKNLIEFQTNKYKTIIEELQETHHRSEPTPPKIVEENVFLSKDEREWMINELAAFLNQ